MTEPDAAPQTYGGWKLIGFSDTKTAKVAVVRCLACGNVRTVNFEALTSSYVACSGCQPPTHMGPTAKSFARDLASAEGRSAKRHRGEDA